MKSTKFDRKCRLRWIILMLQGLSETEALARSTLFTNEGGRADFTVTDLAAKGVFPHTGALAKLIHQGELRGDDPDKVLGTDPANVAIPSWETICPAPFVCGATHLPGLVPELRHNLPPRMRSWNHFDVMQFVFYGEEPEPRVPHSDNNCVMEAQ